MEAAGNTSRQKTDSLLICIIVQIFYSFKVEYTPYAIERLFIVPRPAMCFDVAAAEWLVKMLHVTPQVLPILGQDSLYFCGTGQK